MNTDTLSKSKNRFSTLDVARIGLMIAVIEVSKFALSAFPNVELTSFWLIMFTLFFGWKVVILVPAFILVEGSIYGVHLWWIMYLYVWPLLVFLTWLFRRTESVWFWAFLSGIFGLCFGGLCSLTYFVIGASAGGVSAGIKSAFTWWIAGIPWDFVHCAGNFLFMMVLYHPIKYAFKRIS